MYTHTKMMVFLFTKHWHRVRTHSLRKHFPLFFWELGYLYELSNSAHTSKTFFSNPPQLYPGNIYIFPLGIQTQKNQETKKERHTRTKTAEQIIPWN